MVLGYVSTFDALSWSHIGREIEIEKSEPALKVTTSLYVTDDHVILKVVPSGKYILTFWEDLWTGPTQFEPSDSVVIPRDKYLELLRTKPKYFTIVRKYN